MTEKRNILELIEKESPNLNNLLDPNDVSKFKELIGVLRDTWTKKQIFRTETEMRFTVLNDYKYPTKVYTSRILLNEDDRRAGTGQIIQ